MRAALLLLGAPTARAGVYKDVAYKHPGGGSKALALDLWTPPDYPCGVEADAGGAAGTPTPLIVYMYGGAYQEGSKSLVCGGGYTCGAVTPAMAKRNKAASLSFDYRLDKGQTWPNDAPVTFPAPLQDAVDAIEYVVSRSKQYNVDPTRIVCQGESAGAHLCALLSTFAAYTHGSGPAPPAPAPPAARWHCDAATHACAAAAEGHSTAAKCRAACGAPPPAPPAPAPPAQQVYACVASGAARACEAFPPPFPGSYATEAECEASCHSAPRRVGAAAGAGPPACFTNGCAGPLIAPRPSFTVKLAALFFAPTDILELQPDFAAQTCPSAAGDNDKADSITSRMICNAGPHPCGVGIGEIRKNRAKHEALYNLTVAANPIPYITHHSAPLLPKFWVRAGTCDVLVPGKQSQRLADALTKFGASPDYDKVSGGSHMCQPRASWNSHIKASEDWVAANI